MTFLSFWRKPAPVAHTETVDSPGLREARAAREKSKDVLNKINERNEEIVEIAKTSRELRERNHFGEDIEIAMMRRHRA